MSFSSSWKRQLGFPHIWKESACFSGQKDDTRVRSLPLLCQSSPKRLYSVLWLSLHSAWMDICRIISGIVGRSWELKYRTKPRSGFTRIQGQWTEQKGPLRDGVVVLEEQFKLIKSTWKLKKKIDSMMLSVPAPCLLKGETCGTPFWWWPARQIQTWGFNQHWNQGIWTTLDPPWTDMWLISGVLSGVAAMWENTTI